MNQIYFGTKYIVNHSMRSTARSNKDEEGFHFCMNLDNSEQIQGLATQANLVWSILSAQAVFFRKTIVLLAIKWNTW